MAKNRLLIEWVIGVALMLGLAIASTRVGSEAATLGSYRIDSAVYDLLRKFTQIAPPDDIVIVEIDSDSLEQIGQWPWPRTVHAELLRRLTAAHARVIGLDLLLIERTPDDDLLGQALIRTGNAGTPVVLPVSTSTTASQTTSPLYPVPEIGLKARLAHPHFRIDNDGVVRGLWLTEGGFPALSLAVAARLEPSSISHGALPAIAQQALHDSTVADREQNLAKGDWEAKAFVLLPRLATEFKHLSYAALLRGEVPPEQLRNRIVLVGATAPGLGDRYSTRLIAGKTLVAGVDLHAAALSAIMAAKLARPIDPLSQWLMTLGLVLALMVALYLLAPRAGLILTIAALAAVLVLTALLLGSGLWWSPTGTLMAMALAYPWWSWRRLEVATAGLARQAQALEENAPSILPGTSEKLPAEPIARSLFRLQDAASRAVQLRRFLLQTLERLPYPAIVVAAHGDLLYANRLVGVEFAEQPVAGTPIRQWIKQMAALDIGPVLSQSSADTPSQIEAIDNQGRDWLIDSAVFDDPEWSEVHLIQLVNITLIRTAQREREQTMRFLSHDLRSPQVTILSIIDLQARKEVAPPWLDDIRREASRSLELANGFVELARAEGATIVYEAVDLNILIEESRDACWRQAQVAEAKLITVPTDVDEALTFGDAQLLRRALINLIDNAIKYGPQGGSVTIGLVRDQPDQWCVEVTDEGSGLTESDVEHLFQPYWRGNQLDKPGVGLGLSFVRVVAERHHGSVKVRQSASGGACFQLRIPTHVEDNVDDAGHNTL